MASYRIHHLRDHLRAQFRYAPHISGRAQVKPRDYDAGAAIDAATPYAAYFALRDSSSALQVGDLLETPDGTLHIFKFVGFEDAAWLLPEPKPSEVPVAPRESVTALH